VTETLDLPIIESAPAVAPKVRTEVAVAAAAALDLSKIDLTDVALAQFGNWRQKVKETKADVSTMVLDLSNQSKINEAKSLRQRLFNQPRADARNVSKLLKSKLSSVSKEVGAEEAKVIEAYDEAEKPLTEQIDAAQAKLDAEKEAARRAEEERLAGLRATVDQVMAKWLDRAQADGMTAERIGAGLAALQALLMPDELGDVTAYWTATKAATVTAMERLQVEATRREEAARLEALRIENERIAAEQRAQAEALAEQQRKLEAQAAELERQRKEMEAAQARAAAPVAADTTADTPACVAGKAENPEAAQDTPQQGANRDASTGQSHDAAGSESPAGRGTDGAAALGAAPVFEYSPAQAPQQVLKAEAETPDATDRGEPATTSPVGGPMGAWQPAAAGPAEDPDRSIETSEAEASLLTPEEVARITRAHFAPPVTHPPAVLHTVIRNALEFTEFAAEPFASKFPTQPKPGPEWWAELRSRIERLQPMLKQALGEA
jgi:hypothetical protein